MDNFIPKKKKIENVDEMDKPPEKCKLPKLARGSTKI